MTEYIIGVDIGGTNVRVGLVDEQLHLIKKKSTSITCFSTAAELFQSIKADINELLPDKPPHRIGMVLPAPWNNESETIEDATNVPFLNGCKITEIKDYFSDAQLYFENDVNVIALLESKFGGAKGSHNSLYMTISTGIGSGIIANDFIVHGAKGYAGEIGSIPISHWNAELQKIEFSSLEALCSGKTLDHYAKTILHLKDVEELFKLYHLENEKVKKFMELWLEYLSAGLAASIQILDPDVVILGGGVITHNPWLVERLESKTKKKVFDRIAQNLVFKVTQYNEDAGLIGAANICLEA